MNAESDLTDAAAQHIRELTAERDALLTTVCLLRERIKAALDAVDDDPGAAAAILRATLAVSKELP